jgi:hypothetical protein
MNTTTVTADRLEQITQELAYATAQLEAWKTQRDAAVAQLQEAHAAGLCPTRFTAFGYTFGLQSGRTSTTLTAAGKAAQEALRQQLLQSGDATESVGSPYWVLRKAKAQAAA